MQLHLEIACFVFLRPKNTVASNNHKKSFFENPPTSAIKSLSNIVYHLNKIQDGNDIFLSKDSRRGLFLKQLAAVTGDVKK